ncbi:MAG: hypothetical protein HPY44_21970 [Armatimonadetes bacterium]|nr:hypothetical protein [Armatimonadota bacterium]
MTLQRHALSLAAILYAISLLPALAQDDKPSAQALRTQAPVTVDGVLDEAVWQAGDWQTGFTSAANTEENRGNPRPVDIQTRFKAAFDDQFLCVAVECDEPSPDGIRADITAHDGTVWADDCIEIFFDPAGEGRYYHHFLINTVGAWYDDYGADYGLVHVKLWDCAIRTAAKVDAEARKWTVEVAIPFGGLNLYEDAGPDWAWNVTRERHAGGTLELSSWSPLKGNFHAPKLFGTLKGIDVDFRRFALPVSNVTSAVSRAGSGVNTVTISAQVGNDCGADRRLTASAGLFGKQNETVRTEPFSVPAGGKVTLSLPELKVRSSLPGASFLIELRDEETGQIVKSMVKSLEADYRPVTLSVLEPCYRDTIYATEDIREIIFRVALAPDVEREAVSLALSLKSAGGETVTSRTVPLADAGAPLRLPAADLAVGRYSLAVEVCDANGKTLHKAERTINKLPPPDSGNEVRIDEHGNILVNGKPWIGIGWYGSVPTDDPRADVVALQNLNIPVVVRPPETKSISEAFDQHGIYSVVSVENGRLYYSFDLWRQSEREKGERIQQEIKELPAPSEMTEGYLRQLIDCVRGEPGLLGYYIADEPEIHNTRSDYLENMYRLIAEIDPYHPVIVTNDTLDGIITHGYRCSDILSPDPYSSNLDYVPNFMKRCREVLRPGQTIMLTPWHSSSQAHTTADYGTAPPYPYRVMRNQMLVALTFGARGWTGYTSPFFMPEVELRYGLPPIWREIRFLEPALAEPAPAEPLQIETEGELASWIRALDGHVYLVVVNHKPGDRSATISHPLLKGVSSLFVMSEGRSVAVSDGGFTDDFAEGDARIYTTDPAAAAFPTTAEIEQELARRKQESILPGNLLHVSRGTRASASKGYYAPWFDQYYYYAINGITDDMGWAATHAGADPAWLELTLPEPARIGRVVIHTPNLKDYDLRFQGPDGQVSEAQIRDNEETVVVHRFDPPVPCLKLRVTAISARNVPGASARQVSEIEAYEDPGEGPVTPIISAAAEVQLPHSPIPASQGVETNALWADDFANFNPRDKFAWDGKDEWVVDPAKHSATPIPGGGIKCRSIEGGSGMARIFPYDPAYRFFQVSLRNIEGTGYRFVNVGFSSSSGKPGYRGAINTSRPGIYTVDTHYIKDTYRTGAEKTCFVRTYQAQVDVTFDWFRLVQRPLNGLAVMMADGSPLPEALEQGDQIMFHLILEDPATDATVDVLADSMYSPLQINGQPYVQLFRMTPDGREWGAVVTLGEGTTPFDQTKTGYPVVFRARIVGGSLAETYASASVSFR